MSADLRFTSDEGESALRSLLASIGIRPDPVNGGEIRALFDGPGLRRRYIRATSPTIDDFAELVWDRGITNRRPTVVELLDILADLRLGSGARAQRPRSRSTERETNAAAVALEHEIEVRRKTRLRLYECATCGQKLRASTDTLTAVHRHVDPDTMQETAAPFVLRTVTLHSQVSVPF